MALFGLFQKHKQERESDNLGALQGLEDKIDRLLHELQVSMPDAGGGLPSTVQQFMDRGDKIGAIKAYRELTGVGLAEAKASVENGVVHPVRRMERKMDWILENLGCAPAAPLACPVQSDIERQVVDLLRQGNKIHAIRLYRNYFKTSLRDAAEAVERMEQRKGLSA